MINLETLTGKDIGRKVIYDRAYCVREEGILTSWNDSGVFVKFKGPTGEHCDFEDVRFSMPLTNLIKMDHEQI